MAKFFFDANRIEMTNAEAPSFFNTFDKAMPSLVTHFNLFWADIVNIIKPMVKYGHYSMKELLESEWWWVKMFYDELEKDLKEEAERKKKEQEEQEREYRQQQQQQQAQYNQMMPSHNPYNFQMPHYRET